MVDKQLNWPREVGPIPSKKLHHQPMVARRDERCKMETDLNLKIQRTEMKLTSRINALATQLHEQSLLLKQLIEINKENVRTKGEQNKCSVTRGTPKSPILHSWDI
ncbi:hypothetical protein ACJMK2_038736 [Sinanodonta woodiana]|uniref:Uncharacterized protein n=1 Tax=Sinanodonta woodiana TaxID=1069815 RepID=A0ABD3W9W2_SINWO